MTDMTKVVTAKKEATYGTAADATLAANAILTRNFSTKPVEVDRLDRNLDNRSFGAVPSSPGNERQTITYEVELAGSGTAGTAPAWMELLEGCGMAPPVLTAVTKAEQRFSAITAAPSSLTHIHWIGDQRRRSVGGRGTFSMDFTAGAFPFLSFNFTALLASASPFDVGAPGPSTLTRWKGPVECNVNNTTVLLDGFACIARSIKIDANVPITLRNLIGSRYTRRGNHKATARLAIEAPSMAVKDYLATLRSGALVPMLATHGIVAGNIIEVSAPQAQIIDIAERDEDGVQMWDVDLSLTTSIGAGADDLILTAK